MLRSLAPLVPPRVHAAAFGTIWNRWTTSRRFQFLGPCLLGCGDTEGNYIEHYCRCRVTQQVCRRALNLDPTSHANLHALLLASPVIHTKDALASMGLLSYALYTTTNRIRYARRVNPMTPDIAYGPVVQALREGVRRRSYALGALRRRWQVGHLEEQLVQAPLAAYAGISQRLRHSGVAQRGAKRQRGE